MFAPFLGPVRVVANPLASETLDASAIALRTQDLICAASFLFNRRVSVTSIGLGPSSCARSQSCNSPGVFGGLRHSRASAPRDSRSSSLTRQRRSRATGVERARVHQALGPRWLGGRVGGGGCVVGVAAQTSPPKNWNRSRNRRTLVLRRPVVLLSIRCPPPARLWWDCVTPPPPPPRRRHAGFAGAQVADRRRRLGRRACAREP